MLVLSDTLSISQIDNEAVVLDAATGKYFGLNPTARRIFEVLQKTRSEEAAVDVLAGEFAVDRERLTKDVAAFIDLLLAKGLAHRQP
ncbi:MAG: PqqD family protein [Spirochaetales bacterium]|nr:PqqD family protein [Spirochaetales bacterium]